MKASTEKLLKDKGLSWHTSTYNKVKRVEPKCANGLAPNGFGRYYIEARELGEWVVVCKTWGIYSVGEGLSKAGSIEFLMWGTLRECKQYLLNLINKSYEEDASDDNER